MSGYWKLYQETAMKKEAVKLACVGLDCHRNFSLASGRGEDGRVVWRRRLEHADRAALRKELSKWPAGLPVILEGTFGWAWMSDELKQAGLDAHLSSGRKVAGWREARGLAKSNKRDADLLSELWSEKTTMRNGAAQRWWEVWCAPAEVRDQREWLRYRMSLVRLQTMVKNQIHATLHRHGLVHPYSDLFGTAGRKWLAEVCADEESFVRAAGRKTLKGRLALLEELRKQIAAATKQFRSALRRCAEVRQLTSLPGVSTILAYTVAAEIGRIDRFASGRQLASYSLLAPIADDSGELRDGKPIGRHVGKIGRRTLKYAWIEAARRAVWKTKGRFKDLFDRYTDKGKHDRGRGHIAVAHLMCLIGYSMLKNKSDYQETPPPRPGSAADRERKEKFAAESDCNQSLKRKEKKEEPTRKEELKRDDVFLVRERVLPACAMAAEKAGRDPAPSDLRQTEI
jgi:transposase